MILSLRRTSASSLVSTMGNNPSPRFTNLDSPNPEIRRSGNFAMQRGRFCDGHHQFNVVRMVRASLTLARPARAAAEVAARDRIRHHEGWNGMDRHFRGIPSEAGNARFQDTGTYSGRCTCNRLESREFRSCALFSWREKLLDPQSAF